MYKVILKPKAEKEFAKLSNKLKKKFFEEFKKLSKDPFSGTQLKKIKDIEFGYRLRVGRWRILFALFQKKKLIEIVDIFLEKGKKDYRKRIKNLF